MPKKVHEKIYFVCVSMIWRVNILRYALTKREANHVNVLGGKGEVLRLPLDSKDGKFFDELDDALAHADALLKGIQARVETIQAQVGVSVKDLKSKRVMDVYPPADHTTTNKVTIPKLPTLLRGLP